ncbi:MAG: N-acetyltransferase [Flaviaesturariibacter sp.]|nr:N-acetyltransferase [Flaviaesturariibacter sp.]
MTDIVLHTPRLLLKGISPQVINDLFMTRTEEEIRTFLGVDDKGYLLYKDMHEKGAENHRISLFVFLLVEKESGRPIGECGFHSWNRTHRRAELFYLLRNDEDKRKGFMTEALEAVIPFGFDTMGLHRVAALIDDGNAPSKKLLKRYGFTFEGTMRGDYVVDGTNQDSDCYSLLRHEWP